MKPLVSAVYVGKVVHKRSAPVRHAFTYSVFSLALDVDEIDRLHREVRLFSRNSWNLLSFFDRDHGARDDANIATHVRGLLAAAGHERAMARITLLCYPRILGFAFNPLSVYFCHTDAGALDVIIYEVSNTFGERKSYIIPVSDVDGETIRQQCPKEMYVSPFTERTGGYKFHVVSPGARVFVGVDFFERDVLVLKTYFSGERRSINAARLVASHPLMMLKVIAGIHFEAVRLWWKGVPLVERHTSPRYSFSVVSPAKRGS